jgi:hypothetical protein
MKISKSNLRYLIREFLMTENKRKNDWTVEKAGKLSKNSKLFGSVTFDLPKRKLNLSALIEAEALYITHAHDEPLKNNPDYQNSEEGLKQIEAQDNKGWIILPNEKWLFSVISYWNTLGGDWAKDAKHYIKPESYSAAEDYLTKELYDGKYLQILWSASKRGLKSNDAFLE